MAACMKSRLLLIFALWSVFLTPQVASNVACSESQPPGLAAGVVAARLESLGAAVESLHASFPDRYPGKAFRQRLMDLRRRLDAGESGLRLFDVLKKAQREMLVTENPLLKSEKILFVKRNAYGSYHYYDDHDNGIVRAGMGGNLFKSLFLVQPLWSMYPDGSRSEGVFGNNIGQPGVLIQGRAVPGRNDLIVCTGACHEQMAVGPILLVDLSRDRRSTGAMRSLTPEVESRGTRHRWFLRDGEMVRDAGRGGPVFCDPYPLSDRFFLVSHNPDRPISDNAAYGLWLIDVFGNRVPIYKDPEISCWQPMLLKARPTPPVLPQTAVVAADKTGDAQTEGILFVQDVHQGLDGVPPGRVKYLRVVEQVPRGWEVFQQMSPDDGGYGSPRVVVNKGTHIWVAVLHGVVPVHEDGSALFSVPADRNIFLQALDENYMQVQTMRTFVNLKPGERRSCIGCHEDRRLTTPSGAEGALALKQPPVRPEAQPGDVLASRPVHYPADIQPMLNSRCVRCHEGGTSEGKLDLSGEPTEFFSRSYEGLIDSGYVQGFDEWTANPPDVLADPPFSRGSHTSKLIELLRKGHYEVELSQTEFVRLVTWIDLNLPYYGSYYGKRNIKYRGQPGFRPTPTLRSASVVSSR